MNEPEANGPPVTLDDGRRVELRVCSCCKDDYKLKRRYLVYRDGKLVRIALTWETAIQ